MSESGITVVRPGQSISDAVKQDIQTNAAAKQLVEMKRQFTPKFTNVLNALFQNLGIPDPDFAGSIAMSYATNLAIGTGTSKEDFFKGVEKAWAQEFANLEEVKDQQRKMILNLAKNQMLQRRPIPPQLVEQMKAMECKIPDDMQAYIDAPQEKPAEAAAAPADPEAKA